MRQSPTSLSPGAMTASEPERVESVERVERAPDRRLLGYARAAFVVVTLVIVALDLYALPYAYQSLFTPGALAELRRYHFSPMLYDAIQIAENLGYTLIYLGMALLLFWRRSDDRMAIFCALMLVTFGCGSTGGFLFDITTGTVAPPLASNAILRAVTLVLFAAGQVCFLAFFFLFPSGRFVPRWTRWLAMLATVYWLAAVFFPTLPAGPAGSLTLIFIVAAVVAQVYRYRRVSSPVEREQTKWVVFGFFVGILIIVGPQIAFALLPTPLTAAIFGGSPVVGKLVIGGTWVVGLALVPIFIAVAVLRSRLWEIDTLINRALVYGALTALLAAVYAGLTIGMESLGDAVTGQRPLAIVVSTLAIAALFQPLRRRIQAIIDQRFYRRKYNAARTLTTFGATLRQEIDLNDLSAHLLAVVDETMQPSHSSLWLRRPADSQPRERL